ncbi:MAG: hypothetical protein WBP16_12405, partial [Ferruginibacter sp.]
RNLYHVSAAMWDAWATFDANADGAMWDHAEHRVRTARRCRPCAQRAGNDVCEGESEGTSCAARSSRAAITV